MKPDWVIEQERQLVERIEELQQAFYKAARPYAERLILLRTMYDPPTIVLSQAQYDAMMTPLQTEAPHVTK